MRLFNNDKRRDQRALHVVRKFFPQVQAVQDARRALILQLQPDDIKAEGRKKHTDCVFAEACKRQLKLDGAIISMSRAYLIKGGNATRYVVPVSVSREIALFDRGAPPAPGTYHLRAIGPGHRLGRAKSKTYGPKKKKRPAPRHLTAGLRATLSR